MTNTENPVKDLYKALLDRLGNPITGTFIVAWLLTNWRVPILIFFGSLPEQSRVHLIESIFNEGFCATILSVLILPALCTAAYLFITMLKEAYVSWLNRSEYRTKLNRQRMLEDLKEETEYRDTLRAICAALKIDLKESQNAFKQISELAQNGQDPDRGTFYPQIEKAADFQVKYLERRGKQIESFFNHYNGELPAAYQHFLYKWKPTLSTISGLWLPKDEEPH